MEAAVAQIAGPAATADDLALIREALLAAESPPPLPAGMAKTATTTLARIARGQRSWLEVAWPLALGLAAWWQAHHLIALAAAADRLLVIVGNAPDALVGAVALGAVAVLTVGALEWAQR